MSGTVQLIANCLGALSNSSGDPPSLKSAKSAAGTELVWHETHEKSIQLCRKKPVWRERGLFKCHFSCHFRTGSYITWDVNDSSAEKMRSNMS